MLDTNPFESSEWRAVGVAWATALVAVITILSVAELIVR